MDNLEVLIYVVISIVVFISSIKKKKKKQAILVEDDRQTKENKLMWDFINNKENQEKIKEIPKKKESKPRKKKYKQVKKSRVPIDIVDEIKKEKDIVHEFNLREAIIYNTIMERKYF